MATPATPAIDALLRDPRVRALVGAVEAVAVAEAGGAGEAGSGTPAHLVGGTLRDAILGLPVHDLDVVVAGRGGEIAAALAARLGARLVQLGGRHFAAWRVVCPDGEVVDIWDRGTASLADDLARRDLTINSLAAEARSGALADPFDGLADLRRRVLRATTAESFAADPLRVLRLVRLGLRLPGFTAEPATVELARRAAPGLARVAAERIREELWLVLSHPDAERGLRGLAGLGVYPALWLQPPHGTRGGAGSGGGAGESWTAERGEAGGGSGGEAGGVQAGEAEEHLLELAAAEIAALPRCAAELEGWLAGGPQPADRPAAGSSPADAWEPPDLAAACFAATCRRLTAARGGPRMVLVRLRDAGYVTARQATAIDPLLAAGTTLPESEVGRRRFLHLHGRCWLSVACSCGAAATVEGGAWSDATSAEAEPLAAWRRAAAALCGLARRAGAELIAPPRLLSGADVQRVLGIPPGPRVGEALAALTAAQVDGEVADRDQAEAFVRAWAARVSARRSPARPSGAGSAP